MKQTAEILRLEKLPAALSLWLLNSGKLFASEAGGIAHFAPYYAILAKLLQRKILIHSELNLITTL